MCGLEMEMVRFGSRFRCHHVSAIFLLENNKFPFSFRKYKFAILLIEYLYVKITPQGKNAIFFFSSSSLIARLCFSVHKKMIHGSLLWLFTRDGQILC